MEHIRQAYTTTKAEKCTNRYQHVNSLELYSLIESLGFEKQSANASKKAGDHSRHITIFRSGDVFGDSKLQIVVDNSHDGSRACYIRIGLYRMVCANGLMIGTDLIKPYRIAHTGDVNKKLDDVRYYITAVVESIQMLMERFEKTVLDNFSINDFMRKAWIVRFGNDDGFDPFYFQAKRLEDTGATLWAVYNRVQERLMDKGLKKRSRAITSLRRSVDFNVELNNLANQYVKEAA